MTRLIDANEIEKVLEEKHFNRVLDSDRWIIADIKKSIMDLPTVDAVPVIRCADCKYWSTETEQTSMPNMRRCTWWRNIGTFPIDFCSRAERKETT